MGVVFFPSLPFMGVKLLPRFLLGNAFGGGGASFASHSLFSLYLIPPPFYLSSPLFFFLFFLLPQLSHLLLLLSFFLSPLSLYFFPLFFSPYHTPLFCLSPLSPFFFFFFFLRELLVLSAFQDVIEDTASCNRMQFIRNKERLVMSMNFPIACLFYIIELFEVSN